MTLWGRECALFSCADTQGRKAGAPGLCTLKGIRGSSWSWEERMASFPEHHGGFEGNAHSGRPYRAENQLAPGLPGLPAGRPSAACAPQTHRTLLAGLRCRPAPEAVVAAERAGLSPHLRIQEALCQALGIPGPTRRNPLPPSSARPRSGLP